jgi:hypothetical protein
LIENTERLGHKIDSGRTGDKVAGSDPAVASLGTDDEAAGKPPRPHEIARTGHRETVRPHESLDHPGLGHAWILVAFTLLLAIAIIVWTAAVHSSQRQAHAGSAAAGFSSALLPLAAFESARLNCVKASSRATGEPENSVPAKLNFTSRA